jgi:hypothetical protein
MAGISVGAAISVGATEMHGGALLSQLLPLPEIKVV